MVSILAESAVGISAAHAGAGHHHGNGAYRACIGAEAMSNTFMAIHDDCFAADHGEHVAFGADGGAGRASNAVVIVDVGMLRFGAFGEKLSLLSGVARAGPPAS